MRLALVIHGLGPGGAERAMITLANAWAGRGDTVALLTLDDGAAPPAFALDPRVGRRALAIAGPSRHVLHAAFRNLARIRRLRAALVRENPDVAISFVTETNVVTILAAFGASFPVIVSERVDPRAHRLGGIWTALRAFLYRFADAVVVQGERMAGSLPATIRPLAHVIPNPVARPVNSPDAPDTPRAPARPGRSRIVGLGRLAPQKGFDVLIRAFARIAGSFPDWDLIIWGEGAERPALEALVRETGLGGRIALPGVTARPAEALAAADLFVLPSRYEGFPNALAEAMACNRPVIATDCPSGPADIVRDGIDGLLVAPEDERALVEAIGRLISDEPLRNALAERAGEITARYGVDQIVAHWDELIARVRCHR